MFTLPIFVDSATIESMKADLRKTLPAIKSSHRIEALARALGFQTNAALRAATNQHSSFETIVSWKDFRNYLNGKDFHPTAKPLYLAASKAAIRRIMDRYPMLTRSGIGIHTQNHPEETLQEYTQRFMGERNDMLLDFAVEEFLRSCHLVSEIPKTKTITTKYGSYKLKHIAEKLSFTYPDGEVSEPKYVCSGSLVFAAIHLGFKFKENTAPHSINFNMQQRSIEYLDRKIRPSRYAA
ncbi:MAG: hypothetical protein HND56_00660 [Pseudomonadota bacterium]|nr:hypothetical protein [Pseudomonadota bacterium]QKK04280.1 MAG: hypothetical protein HND56_00660 [Pseudomonadota bacterium]